MYSKIRNRDSSWNLVQRGVSNPAHTVYLLSRCFAFTEKHRLQFQKQVSFRDSLSRCDPKKLLGLPSCSFKGWKLTYNYQQNWTSFSDSKFQLKCENKNQYFAGEVRNRLDFQNSKDSICLLANSENSDSHRIIDHSTLHDLVGLRNVGSCQQVKRRLMPRLLQRV